MTQSLANFKSQITPEFVARSLGLTLSPALLTPSAGAFSFVTTDSRKVTTGCLFVAIRGENFDGHAFITSAIAKGATGIVCQRGTMIENPHGALVFSVEDTLQAFRKIAASWRREFSIPIAVIAGSVGKTTTKELFAAILSGKYSRVLKTTGSQNGFVGIPMTLMELGPEHDAAVIEVGIDEIGAMKPHMDLVGATASVLTTIGPEHLEKLRDIPTIAQEEGIALTAVAQNGGLVAISLDDDWIRPHAKTIRSGKHVTFTMQKVSPGYEATFEAEYHPAPSSLKIQGETYLVPLPGIHNAKNLLAAISLALGMGLTPLEIQKGLKTFKSVSGRSEVRELGSFRIICDYYNANPTSTAAGLLMLTELARGSKRFACLADMLEMGDGEEKLHRELAPLIIREGIEHVYLYGTRMKALEDELKKLNFQKEMRHFSSQSDMGSALREKLKPGDTVLIKGSHSMKMEAVFEGLSKWVKP